MTTPETPATSIAYAKPLPARARARAIDRALATAVRLDARRPRKAGTWYVVRDATGTICHTGATKHLALRPYAGTMTSREARPRAGQDTTKPITMRRAPIWRFLKLHGWTCRLEAKAAAAGASPALTTD